MVWEYSRRHSDGLCIALEESRPNFSTLFHPLPGVKKEKVSGASGANLKKGNSLIFQVLFCATSYNRGRDFLPSKGRLSPSCNHPFGVDGKKDSLPLIVLRHPETDSFFPSRAERGLEESPILLQSSLTVPRPLMWFHCL